MINQFFAILPEILLASIAIFMQIAAVIFRKYSENITKLLNLALLALVFFIYYTSYNNKDVIMLFTGSYIVSSSIYQIKAIILAISLCCIDIYIDLNKIENTKPKSEFSTLVMLSTLGIFVSISARDFLLLFSGLELQALCGYALAAFNRNKKKSSEAALKYFILGALMSAIMLLGMSFLYGFSKSINFYDIGNVLMLKNNIGLIIGVILVLSGILFKLSSAPLHVWAPDVYEGAPTSSVVYFATAQKLGVLVVLIYFIDSILGINFKQISQDLIRITAILSMIIGSVGALFQTSLKRLMAYSSILNIGYVLIGISLKSYNSAITYMFIYVITVIGFFTCLIALFGQKSDNATFEDLKGIAQKRKALAASISIFVFSMIGLPPFAGFLGKYLILYDAIMKQDMLLAIIGIITSVIASFYYLKIIKYMYFMQRAKEFKIMPTNNDLSFIAGFTVIFTLFFIVYYAIRLA